MVKEEFNLTLEDYLFLEKGNSLPCPFPRCKGIVKKVKESEEIYTKYEASVKIYLCNENSNHKWESVIDF